MTNIETAYNEPPGRHQRRIDRLYLHNAIAKAEASLDSQEHEYTKRRRELILAMFSSATSGARVAAIIAAVSLLSGVSKGELIGRSKNHNLSRWRWTAIYLSRIKTSLSYGSIGEIFERDHSSILSGAANAKKLCKGKIAMVEALLNGEPA